MDTIIRTDKLTRHYGPVKAATDISIEVKKGEIYGFLGLNGAGKTTVIRMLLGMIRPTSGTSYLFGRKVTSNGGDLWNRVGYMVEIPYAYPDLTVRENLDILRRLRYLPSRDHVDRIIDQLQLGEYVNRKARQLSLGNAQRLGLAKALIHKPELLILDEPANSLDPAGIFEIRKLLTRLAHDEGVTIFISSHILGEIAKFATRIGIIHEGLMLQELDTETLEKLCLKRLTLDCANRDAAAKLLNERGFKLSVSGSGIFEIFDDRAVDHPEEIASMLVHAGNPPRLLKVEEEDLETYFLKTVGRIGGQS